MWSMWWDCIDRLYSPVHPGPCLQWVKSCQECIECIPCYSLSPSLYNDTTNAHYASLLNHLKVISLHLSLCQECQSFHSATGMFLYSFKSCFLITFKSPHCVILFKLKIIFNETSLELFFNKNHLFGYLNHNSFHIIQ